MIPPEGYNVMMFDKRGSLWGTQYVISEQDAISRMSDVVIAASNHEFHDLGCVGYIPVYPLNVYNYLYPSDLPTGFFQKIDSGVRSS